MSGGYLTIRQLGPFLREHGFPIGDSTLHKATLPSINTGPPHAGFWGQKKLFEPETVLTWARANVGAQPKRLGPQRRKPKRPAPPVPTTGSTGSSPTDITTR
jgi:hypothetical protein